MSVVMSTSFNLQISRDKVVIAAQDVIDSHGWLPISLSSSELVCKDHQYDKVKGFATEIVAKFNDLEDGTNVSVTATMAGFGPINKRRAAEVMGKFVNSLSLRVQTQSLAINPTVQIGEGQGGSSEVIPNRYDLLKEAKSLLDSGVLTEEEFQSEKSRILKS
jgi:hypothetical protein